MTKYLKETDSYQRLSIGFVLIVALLAGYIYFVKTNTISADLSRQFINNCTSLKQAQNNNPNAGFNLQNKPATTTLVYIPANTATTTVLNCNVSTAQMGTMNIQLVSTSSRTYLYWVTEESYNGIDFYPDDSSQISNGFVASPGTTTPSISHERASTTNSWVPFAAGGIGQSQATSAKAVLINPLNTRFFRVRMWTSGDNGGVYVELMTKETN